MNKKNLVIVVVIAVLLVLDLAGGYYFILLPRLSNGPAVALTPDALFGWKYPVVKFPTTGPGDIAYSSIRDPGGIPNGLPVRLQIPIIGVNSAIEDALITPDGRMDVPAGSVDVAWFSLGPHPGQTGSAVIGGHFGVNGSKKFVFYDLDKLKVGDKIYVVNDKGETLAFQVKLIKLFDRNADATTVFTSDDNLAHLNLITCEGVWNQVNGTYPQRRVVFTDSIPAEGAAPASTPTSNTVTASVPTVPIPSFDRSLGIGSEGADVVALQNALEQRGFLTMPAGIAKGHFGALTRAAVVKYQASVGLPSAGLFGPLTRAKLSFEVANSAVLPNTGAPSVAPIPAPVQGVTTSNNAEQQLSFSQIFVESVKSLFATWQDALITCLLFLAIILIVFKIIW